MVFAGKKGVVPNLLQRFGKEEVAIGEGEMQFGRTRIVGIASRNEACAGWTTATGRQVGIIEDEAILREPVKGRGRNKVIAVRPEITLANVVRNEEDEVGSIRLIGLRGQCSRPQKDERSEKKRRIS